VPGPSSIDYKRAQIIASKMRDHKKRRQVLQDLSFNNSLDTAIQYFITKDPALVKVGTFGDNL